MTMLLAGFFFSSSRQHQLNMTTMITFNFSGTSTSLHNSSSSPTIITIFVFSGRERGDRRSPASSRTVATTTHQKKQSSLGCNSLAHCTRRVENNEQVAMVVVQKHREEEEEENTTYHRERIETKVNRIQTKGIELRRTGQRWSAVVVVGSRRKVVRAGGGFWRKARPRWIHRTESRKARLFG